MFVDPTRPNQADYTTFLYNTVGIPSKNLPATSDIIVTSLAVALDIVNEDLNCGSARIYTLAVYNLAADRLFNYAPDQANQTFFQDWRVKLRITDVSVGVVSSVTDQGTTSTLLNPEQMKLFTLQDLQTLKTVYGRQYMSYAQMYGRSLWGLT